MKIRDNFILFYFLFIDILCKLDLKLCQLKRIIWPIPVIFNVIHSGAIVIKV